MPSVLSASWEAKGLVGAATPANKPAGCEANVATVVMSAARKIRFFQLVELRVAKVPVVNGIALKVRLPDKASLSFYYSVAEVPLGTSSA